MSPQNGSATSDISQLLKDYLELVFDELAVKGLVGRQLLKRHAARRVVGKDSEYVPVEGSVYNVRIYW